MHNSTSTPARSGNPSRHLRRTLTGDRNQCPGCGEFFNSTLAFEKHRGGLHAGNRRYCLSPIEMLAIDMARNAAGFWVSERRTSEADPGCPVQVARIDLAAAIS